MADILTELQQKVAMKPALEAKLRELQDQRREYDREVISLRVAFRTEQEDVEKLEGRSLANYFFQVVGKLDEKLDKERKEAYAAKVKLDAAERELTGIEAEEMRKAAIAKRAPVLGKWLWIIFWLIIPSIIGSLMSNESTVKILPALFMPGQIINAICSLIYGAILLKLGSEEDHYRTAGICALVAGASSALAAIINGGSDGATWILIFTIPAAIVALVSEYNEYMAHSAVLSGVDNELSEKWEVLWKWYIGLFLGIFGSILVMLIIPVLGAIAVIGCTIGTVVVGILKLVYLYRTAKIFREYPVGV